MSLYISPSEVTGAELSLQIITAPPGECTGGGGGGQGAYNEIRFTESTCCELKGTVVEYFDWCAFLKTCVGDSSTDDEQRNHHCLLRHPLYREVEDHRKYGRRMHDMEGDKSLWFGSLEVEESSFFHPGGYHEGAT